MEKLNFWTTLLFICIYAIARATLFIHSSLSLYLKYTPFISGCKKHFLSLLFPQTVPNSLQNTMGAKERTNSLVTQPDETGLSNTSTSSLSLLFSTNTSKQPTKPVRAKESQGEYKFLGSSSWWNWVVSCQLHQQVYSHFYFQQTFHTAYETQWEPRKGQILDSTSWRIWVQLHQQVFNTFIFNRHFQTRELGH